MNEIERLLIGRKAIDDYNEIIKIKGIKSEKDINKFKSILENIELDFSSFNDFNLKMNFYEADRCFRIRDKENHDIPALCDACQGRAKGPCYSILFNSCGSPDTLSINQWLPDEESEIIKEQKDYSKMVNIIPPWYGNASGIFYLHNSDLKNFCSTTYYQIKEMNFDIFWGMDAFKKVADSIYYLMISQNNNGE